MNLFQKIKLFPFAMRGFLFGDPERNGEYRFLRSFIKPGMTILDIGANIGEYSEKILETSTDVKIHCFEPVPQTFNQLKKRLGDRTNITFNKLACSDKPGKAEIHVYGELWGTNSLHSHPEMTSENMEKVPIELTTIDNYLRDHKIKQVDFVKIDVEGHEISVIRGAKKSIESGRVKAFQLEYNFLWKNTRYLLQDAFELLTPHGYTFYRLTPLGKTKIKTFTPALENFPPATNYIAILE